VQYIPAGTFIAVTANLCTLKVHRKTSEIIFASIQRLLAAFKLEMKKLSGLCTDGGSEYRGTLTGVAVQLLKLNPWMISAHCFALCKSPS
jgi:hypothetical protein